MAQYQYQTVDWDSSQSFEEISDCAWHFGFRRLYYPYSGSHKPNMGFAETQDFYDAHTAINTLLREARA